MKSQADYQLFKESSKMHLPGPQKKEQPDKPEQVEPTRLCAQLVDVPPPAVPISSSANGLRKLEPAGNCLSEVANLGLGIGRRPIWRTQNTLFAQLFALRLDFASRSGYTYFSELADSPAP